MEVDVSEWINKFRSDPVGTVYHRYYLNWFDKKAGNIRDDIILAELEKVDYENVYNRTCNTKHKAEFVDELKISLYECYLDHNRRADNTIKEYEELIQLIEESKY